MIYSEKGALHVIAVNDFVSILRSQFWFSFEGFWYKKNNFLHPTLKTMTDSLPQENL